jgi:hypothetical protein
LGGEPGFDPYACIAPKIGGLFVAGGGIISIIAGRILVADDMAVGTIQTLTGFAAFMIGVHLWFGRAGAWIGYLVDFTSVAFMGLALSDWLGLWGYLVVALDLTVGGIWFANMPSDSSDEEA